MSTFDDIVTAAQSLPTAERARLITLLWDNLSPDDWPPPSPEWLEEANRRSDALEAGDITSSPWPDVRQRARRKAGLDG